MFALTAETRTAYVVEVSGWDHREDFFVETTELHWSEDSGKQVLLLRPIVSGALLFLRLMDPTGVERVHPVPYRAEDIGVEKNGEQRVRLVAARPQRFGSNRMENEMAQFRNGNDLA